jgi:Methyltransferase domain
MLILNVMLSSSPLRSYLTDHGEIPGFFQYDSMVLWDFFFSAQGRLGIPGDFLEIGVYKGRSAVLGALYVRPEERAVFVDISLAEETRKLIRRAKPQNNIFLERRSCDLLAERILRESPGAFRWCHIDGDHTGYSTSQDLHTAAYLTSEQGIICVDDFFSFRYPQLTAAVYAFLSDFQPRFRMLFCGANKCYLCRANAYALYESDIRDRLARHIKSCDLKMQIYKTSYSSDDGCFSMWLAADDRPMYGMDENPDLVPY